MKDDTIIVIKKCPSCGGNWRYYEVALGYESRTCSRCNLDIQDIKLCINPPKEGIYFEINYDKKGLK